MTALLKKEIYDELVDTVWHRQEEIKLEKMSQLAIKNQVLRKSNAPCFLFEGVWYTHPHSIQMPQDTSHLDHILDVSLRAEAYAILHTKSFEAIEEESSIKNLFSQILQNCSSVSDIKKILPSVLKLPNKIYDLWFAEPSMTEEELYAFKEKNSRDIGILKALFMKEILMAKVDET